MKFKFKIKALDEEDEEVMSGLCKEDDLMELLHNVKRFGAVRVEIAGSIKK